MKIAKKDITKKGEFYLNNLLQKEQNMEREFLEGNEAIARGAMKAKCDFFAGYPITPASYA
jgi:TPP-dependent indolepyruvate ferredoxin oxidoreductase alpha subunit